MCSDDQTLYNQFLVVFLVVIIYLKDVPLEINKGIICEWILQIKSKSISFMLPKITITWPQWALQSVQWARSSALRPSIQVRKNLPYWKKIYIFHKVKQDVKKWGGATEEELSQEGQTCTEILHVQNRLADDVNCLIIISKALYRKQLTFADKKDVH